MRSLCFAAAIAAALPATGCSMFMHSIEKPTAQVRDVAVSQVSFTGATGQMKLDVMNPNSFAVPLSGVDWQLAICNGASCSRALTGTVSLSQEIPAKALAPVLTTLSISASDAVAVATALASGAREYRIDVKLHFSTRVGQIDVAVDHQGQLASAIAGL